MRYYYSMMINAVKYTILSIMKNAVKVCIAFIYLQNVFNHGRRSDLTILSGFSLLHFSGTTLVFGSQKQIVIRCVRCRKE